MCIRTQIVIRQRNEALVQFWGNNMTKCRQEKLDPSILHVLTVPQTTFVYDNFLPCPFLNRRTRAD